MDGNLNLHPPHEGIIGGGICISWASGDANARERAIMLPAFTSSLKKLVKGLSLPTSTVPSQQQSQEFANGGLREMNGDQNFLNFLGGVEAMDEFRAERVQQLTREAQQKLSSTKSPPSTVCYSSSGAIFVIRVRLGPHKLLLSSLPFLSDIKKQHVVLDTLYMGATLHHCYKFIKKLRIQEISDAIRNTEDPEVRAELARSLDRALDAK
ncbi:unnamed protein product [Darwinula stevensoni]|uniref:Uncharacterized protein n=1 Tax=Darwinula stevensoni TaxID=69355 RepID=A0A7R9A2H6_9CRUS|nr:unnamed protein product [Darwinula stevensoni]CAG0879957.1 unnamed protein product [Darwinula stevensoni]